MGETPKNFSAGIKVLRWIMFLPVGALLIAVAQMATATAATHLTWWISAPLIMFFGAIIAGAGFLPARISPNPIVGCAILLTLFLLFECIALISAFSATALYPLIMRIYTDIAIVTGAVIATKFDKPAV